MKFTLLISILACLSIQMYGQTKRFSFGLEYSPNFTNVTSPIDNEGFRLAHNVFLKNEYSLTKKIDITIGFGYLNTREFDRLLLDGQLDIDAIESVRNHNYLVVPIGIKFRFGSFFVHPEIGLAYNFDNTTRQTSYLSNGSIVKQSYKDTFNNRHNNKFTVPVFLTIGNEIDLGSCSILLGVKGYYSTNKIADFGFRDKHYYGFGVVTGVKF